MYGPNLTRWSPWRRARRLARVRLRLETAAQAGLRRASSGHTYSFAIGALALLLTVSAVPFASILIVAVWLRRERWPEIVLLSSLGSAAGGVVVYLLFHHVGWNQIAIAYPDLTQSKAWADATRWVSAYGTWALLAIAATPLPQTPALIFTAVSRLPIAEVFLALFLGKLLKYGVYGFLAVKFPSWFRRLAPFAYSNRDPPPAGRLDPGQCCSR
jgi:membrane protein YqaA with SNARE-associated domain